MTTSYKALPAGDQKQGCDIVLGNMDGGRKVGGFSNPDGPAIVYAAGKHGCCLPQGHMICCADALKARTYTWIMDSRVEENMGCFVCFAPHRCACCTAMDIAGIQYYDREPFAAGCCGNCQSGFGTQEDFLYMAYCIPVSCCYNMCCRCCYGDFVGRTPCRNDHGMFTCMSRCGCWSPVLCCLEDGKLTKEALLMSVYKNEPPEEQAEIYKALGITPPGQQPGQA